MLLHLRKHLIGILSLLYILCCAAIAIFAYYITIDKSENANQMHLSIHSKPVGFTTKMLCIPSQTMITEANIDNTWKSKLWGIKSTFNEIPIAAYKIDTLAQKLLYQDYSHTSSDDVITEYQSIDLKDFGKNITAKEIKDRYIKKAYFPLGTDKYGRDLFSRLIIGTRISFTIGFIAVFISLMIGIPLGAISGYYGGIWDKVILWFINVVWSVPTLLFVIAITFVLGKGFWQVFIAVGFTMWVEVARVVRGQVISVKEKDYITAARALGYRDMRIICKHILPNCLASIIVITAANFASAILIESGLSFLGIGAQPPIPSWGSIIKDHYAYIIVGKWHLAIFPGLAIMSLVLAFMLLGNSIRDYYDVHLSK